MTIQKHVSIHLVLSFKITSGKVEAAQLFFFTELKKH